MADRQGAGKGRSPCRRRSRGFRAKRGGFFLRRGAGGGTPPPQRFFSGLRGRGDAATLLELRASSFWQRRGFAAASAALSGMPARGPFSVRPVNKRELFGSKACATPTLTALQLGVSRDNLSFELRTAPSICHSLGVRTRCELHGPARQTLLARNVYFYDRDGGTF